jgi:hypothetical protein
VELNGRLLRLTGPLGAIVLLCLAIAVPARGDQSALAPRALVRAETIRAQLDARYRVLPSRGLAVTEASSTAVVESFALLSADLLGIRYLPADNGIWYTICPVGAACPYPARRVARSIADLVPRRLALELVLRTFLETSAEVVAVSLPTADFTAFIVERSELAREVDLRSLSRRLRHYDSRALPPALDKVVDRLTRPRLFLSLGLEPSPGGRLAWAGVPWSRTGTST